MFQRKAIFRVLRRRVVFRILRKDVFCEVGWYFAFCKKMWHSTFCEEVDIPRKLRKSSPSGRYVTGARAPHSRNFLRLRSCLYLSVSHSRTTNFDLRVARVRESFSLKAETTLALSHILSHFDWVDYLFLREWNTGVSHDAHRQATSGRSSGWLEGPDRPSPSFQCRLGCWIACVAATGNDLCVTYS